MKTDLPRFSRYWRPNPGRRSSGSWLVSVGYAAEAVSAVRRMSVDVRRGSGFADLMEVVETATRTGAA